MKARIKKTGEIVNVAGVFLEDGILTIDDVEFVSENNNNHTEKVVHQLLAQKKRDIVYFPIEIAEDEKEVILDILEEFVRLYSCDCEYYLIDKENEYAEMQILDVMLIIDLLRNSNSVGELSFPRETSSRMCKILRTLIHNTDTRSGLIYFSFDEYMTSSLD